MRRAMFFMVGKVAASGRRLLSVGGTTRRLKRARGIPAFPVDARAALRLLRQPLSVRIAFITKTTVGPQNFPLMKGRRSEFLPPKLDTLLEGVLLNHNHE